MTTPATPIAEQFDAIAARLAEIKRDTQRVLEAPAQTETERLTATYLAGLAG